MKHPKYAVVINRGDTSFGAYVPDMPACAAVSQNTHLLRSHRAQ
jgi:hypothetical protein